MLFRLLGNFTEAAKDLSTACKIDFDEQADEWLKEVGSDVVDGVINPTLVAGDTKCKEAGRASQDEGEKGSRYGVEGEVE